ncbi:MAG: proprotein convertase P-domain-containing protein [Planctomycetes bacterium]|nr:proprotein convertase P-domain-containing protein [Planctomycetota bacterium]
MTLQKNVLTAAAFLTAALSASAQTKDAAFREMNQVEMQMKAASNSVQLARLQAKYDALHAQVFGSTQAVPAPQFAVAPAYSTPGICGGLVSGTPGTTLSFSNAPALAIVDNATVSDSITVSGLGTSTFDVDLFVNITHTWGSDLDISLTSPLGTVVDVCSDNGGSFDNTFAGTLFDDQSANNPVTYVYTDLVAAPDLRSEVSMNASFAGQNPNGTWTLSIFDDAGGDIGVLHNWTLTVTDGTITVIPDGPLGAPTTFTTGPVAYAIADNSTTTVPLTVAGGSTSIVDVNAYVEIVHTWNSDLEISLQSPALTTVMLSDNWGGANDDVFNGTTFDQQSTNPIASYVFADLVVAPDLRPDGNLGLFAGENANGTWNLIVTDQAGGDIGSVNKFDLIFRDCASTTVSYCTPGTSTNGCNATMSATGTPSISGGAGSFVLTASGVEGQKNGLIFYGITGRSNANWGTGTSFLCVKAPTQRTDFLSTGGNVGACDGSLSLDFFGFMNTHIGALGQPIAAGQVFNAQAWYRDPPAPKTTNMSDGIEFTLAP